ncbi:MAG: response regulator transcription factor [Firmicutes bacterium]|nr:response regulator transcription factor [Bacillota bacterium]MCL5038781.1 response regulator transcription factor [Bacillota bacterium]
MREQAEVGAEGGRGMAGETETVKVLLVDRFAPFHQCLRDVLTPETGMEVVATAEDGEQALASIGPLAPDAVLVDVGLFRPGQAGLPELRRLNGVETARLIRARYPGMVIILLATEDHEEYHRAAKGLGLDGFLAKRRIQDDLIQLLAESITRRRGGRFVSG